MSLFPAAREPIADSWYDIRDYGAGCRCSERSGRTRTPCRMRLTPRQFGLADGAAARSTSRDRDSGYAGLGSRRPIWLHGDKIKIQGEGSKTPSFVPSVPRSSSANTLRFWNVAKSTYARWRIDYWNGLGRDELDQRVEVQARPVRVPHRRLFPPTNGSPEFAPQNHGARCRTVVRNRTQRGVAQGRYPLLPTRDRRPHPDQPNG